MGVADLRFRPPPRGGETVGGRETRRRGPDERIYLVKNDRTVRRPPSSAGYRDMNTMYTLCHLARSGSGIDRLS